MMVMNACYRTPICYKAVATGQNLVDGREVHNDFLFHFLGHEGQVAGIPLKEVPHCLLIPERQSSLARLTANAMAM